MEVAANLEQPPPASTTGGVGRKTSDAVIAGTVPPRYKAAAELLARTQESASRSAVELRGQLDEYRACLKNLLETSGAIQVTKRFQYLQALEDAIAYRRMRTEMVCADCGFADNTHCDDHGRDVELIAEYAQTIGSVCV